MSCRGSRSWRRVLPGLPPTTCTSRRRCRSSASCWRCSASAVSASSTAIRCRTSRPTCSSSRGFRTRTCARRRGRSRSSGSGSSLAQRHRNRRAGSISPAASERGSRIVENEPELVALLSARGFTVVDPGTLSVADQITLFAEAECIVAPHGGALTNLAFASPGASVIELFAPDYVQGCYWKLSTCVPGLTYRYLVGTGRPAHAGPNVGRRQRYADRSTRTRASPGRPPSVRHHGAELIDQEPAR